KSSQPTKNDIIRYKLWLEQRYRSPYTGEIIPLSKLFTTAYQIEHIIPQKRYFDDSLSNKVICEAEVNGLKDNLLGYEFIKNNHGQKVQVGNKVVTIFSVEEYEEFVKLNYSNIRGKMKKLLMDDIPEKFIERQLNDTRYISKEIKRLLSNIVREKNENGEIEQEETSKKLISCTGAITSKLKQDWGLNDKWNELILPRFKRLNEITSTNDFISYNKEGHEIPDVPLELKKGFTKKRIDHRHHAMDAIIIACATRNHINYLNNESAKDEKKRYDLKHLLCDKTKTDEIGNYKWVFKKPWDSFPQDVKTKLDEITISFKQNLRVINKNTNYYQKYNDKGKKEFVKQDKGANWAIRKPMHKETVFGEVNLRKIKEVSFNEALENPKVIVEKDFKNKIIELQTQNLDNKQIKKYFDDNKDIWSDINLLKIKVYYFTKDIINSKTGQPKERYFSTRKELGSIFKDEKSKFKEFDKVIKVINDNITDTGVQKILLRHLENNKNDPELAFSPEGIEEMNINIKELNNGVNHKPILKVRWCEKAEKFAVGVRGNKKDKFVESADSTNMFFAVYQQKIQNNGIDGMVRDYKTIPLREVVLRQKQGLSIAPDTNESGYKLLFILSIYDLVYIPTNEEIINGIKYDKIDFNRIYAVNDFNKKTIYFTPAYFAKAIAAKEIDTSFDKKTASIDGIPIKEICVPIKLDRLGNVIL
ncbi:MAG: HNH endonuclease domain-containing protein, partial [Bacteroidales bacterium]|nr:HNH endonuclease domain-containing protein [Bacteroidales bacterium]